jgi:hypothetical protein
VSPVLVGVLAGGLLAAQYWFSDRIALYATGGRIVSPQEEPRLHGVVDRLCALSNLPKPAVAVADTDLPNAFATGRTPKRAVVCVTTGLLRRLEADELEGVLSHELSHVTHRDVAVMTVASFLGVLAGLATRFALYSGMVGGLGRSDDGDDEDSGALVVLVVVVVSAAVYALSFLLTRALSHWRTASACPRCSRPTRLWTPGWPSSPGCRPSSASLCRTSVEGRPTMRILDVLLGRTRAVLPDLDRLFALPAAAITTSTEQTSTSGTRTASATHGWSGGPPSRTWLAWSPICTRRTPRCGTQASARRCCAPSSPSPTAPTGWD